jgi:hypothetical protein
VHPGAPGLGGLRALGRPVSKRGNEPKVPLRVNAPMAAGAMSKRDEVLAKANEAEVQAQRAED